MNVLKCTNLMRIIEIYRNLQKCIETRIFRRYAPLILAPAGATWCLRRVLGPSGPYPVGLGSMKTINSVSHGHIGGVRFLNFLDQMSVAKVMRSSTLALLTLLAAARPRKSSINLTVLNNFHFLAHPQIMHSL